VKGRCVMAGRRKRERPLPRLTLLAYSRAELQRFSDAAELVAAAARELPELMQRLRVAVDVLEKRSQAAHKANRTRKEANGPPLIPADVLDALPDQLDQVPPPGMEVNNRPDLAGKPG
jgi:hypothetical protein